MAFEVDFRDLLRNWDFRKGHFHLRKVHFHMRKGHFHPRKRPLSKFIDFSHFVRKICFDIQIFEPRNFENRDSTFEIRTSNFAISGFKLRNSSFEFQNSGFEIRTSKPDILGDNPSLLEACQLRAMEMFFATPIRPHHCSPGLTI